jgi:hypothetical protein
MSSTDKNKFIIEIEVHKARDIAENLSDLEGMFNVIKMSKPLLRNIKERIKTIKDILKEAKLRGDERC